MELDFKLMIFLAAIMIALTLLTNDRTPPDEVAGEASEQSGVHSPGRRSSINDLPQIERK
ncbi:MAG TPA: hypothetical protein VM050_08735 [Patescibacteria group bacterium]|nr:hypothetical protein [Patescibacteria group bacterium]